LNARKLKYLVGVAADSLWSHRGRNIFSATIICLSFLIVGVFLSLANNLQHVARQVSADTVVTFFLDKNVPAADLGALERRVRTSLLVAEVRVVAPGEALERFRRSFPELRDILDNLKANPFPTSLEARLKDNTRDSGKIAGFVREVRAVRGVADAQYNRDWVDRMQSLSRLARAVGFFLGGILVLASFFIVSNVIKLNVIARKNEIEILRLVGATNLFIRVPFLLEGMALGILGSLISLALLFVAVRLFPVYVGSLGALQQVLNFRFLTPSQALGLVAAGAAIGLLGSASSVSRFLKI
jgi:cell division transport system permease protein